MYTGLLQVGPGFLCNSTAVIDALEGAWDYKHHVFLLVDEKVEGDRRDDMENEANGVVKVYISKDHQRALTIDADSVVSEETRLMKGCAAPHVAKSDEFLK